MAHAEALHPGTRLRREMSRTTRMPASRAPAGPPYGVFCSRSPAVRLRAHPGCTEAVRGSARADRQPLPPGRLAASAAPQWPPRFCMGLNASARLPAPPLAPLLGPFLAPDLGNAVPNAFGRNRRFLQHALAQSFQPVEAL